MAELDALGFQDTKFIFEIGLLLGNLSNQKSKVSCQRVAVNNDESGKLWSWAAIGGYAQWEVVFPYSKHALKLFFPVLNNLEVLFKHADNLGLAF